jgi:steroid 5-alpha reductase family enzyme
MIGTPQAPHDAMDFWLPVVVCFVIQLISFVFCSLKADNGYIDVFWGMLFLFPLASLAVKDGIQHKAGQPLLIANPRYIITLACIAIWCFRLSWHICRRHTVEDWRFKRIRDKLKASGPCWMHVDFFLQLFLPQAITAMICNCAALYVGIYTLQKRLVWTDYLGLALFIFGFLLEAIADQQLYRFKHDDSSRGRFCKTGLWRFSRHPNYFGEIIMWWGIFSIACSIQWGWATIYAPAITTLVVRYVTGVSMLEEKWEKDDKEEFE